MRNWLFPFTNVTAKIIMIQVKISFRSHVLSQLKFTTHLFFYEILLCFTTLTSREQDTAALPARESLNEGAGTSCPAMLGLIQYS